MRPIAATLLLSLAVCFAAAAGDASLIPAAKRRTQKTTATLTPAERALVAGSRHAIIATGMSEPYFDRHFTLAKVINQPGDRRIVWKFSLNDYNTSVTDVLGYYAQNGQRIDTHSVTTVLGKTSEIATTISQRKANQIMQRCIGSFAHPVVEYRATYAGARLLLTAEAIRKPEPQRNEKQEREPQKTKSRTDQGEVVEGDNENAAPIIIGTVDLQTGGCTKGQLVVAP